QGSHLPVSPAHPPVGDPQALEGLRRGHLVDQVQVDVKQIRFALADGDHVVFPDLRGHGPPPNGHARLSTPGLADLPCPYLLSASARTRSASSRSSRASASLRSRPVTSPIRRKPSCSACR